MIASQIDRQEQGLNFPQEVDQKRLYEQCSVFCEYTFPIRNRRAASPPRRPRAALTLKGVAVVIVNGDLFREPCEDALPWSVTRPHPLIRPNDSGLAQRLRIPDKHYYRQADHSGR
jgi:pyruvate dehydrogenase (quinone)